MNLTPEMKEIALRVKVELSKEFDQAEEPTEEWACVFAERFLPALPKPEPGVRSPMWGKEGPSPHSWVFLKQGMWHWTEDKRDWYDGVNVEEVIPLYTAPQDTFQRRVEPWLLACFGEEISNDKSERNHRFLEESLELVQATGCTQSEAHQLVDYVYGRPMGEPQQEVGGVMVTLAALCRANDFDMHSNGETELARIWTKVEKIRAKQAAKPKHSPLPEYTLTAPTKDTLIQTDTAAIEQRVVEACAKLVSRCQFSGSSLAKQIRSGKWREFL